MTQAAEARRRIAEIERLLSRFRREADLASDAISHIDIDMANSAEEFAVTTGKPAEEYPLWRRKANWARHHKTKELARLQEDIARLEEELADLHMALYAAEAGYLGDSHVDLLVAMNHMMMEVLQLTGYQPTAKQVGLLAAVRSATKGG